METNKGERERVTQKIFKRRLKDMGYNPDDKKHYELKQQGKTCSCWMCSDKKYKRHESNKDVDKEII